MDEKETEQPEITLNTSLEEVLHLIVDGEEVPMTEINSVQEIAVDTATPVATISLGQRNPGKPAHVY